ncbi:MAG: transcriptional regulator [Rhizobium sp.]|nr:transcriptional regulator [Rhizobium sp.]
MPQDSKSTDPNSGPRSLTRVLMILSLLAESKKDMTLTEISENAGWPKSSISVLIRALVSKGYLERIGDRYRLGWASYQLAGHIAARRDLMALVRPHMIELSRETGQTVLFTEIAPDQKNSVHREVLQSDRPIRYVTLIGETRPLYATAQGTCLVSFMPMEWINEYLRTAKFTRFTDHTLVNRTELRAKFLTTRERGYAVAIGEYNEAVGGISAPLIAQDGNLLGAVGVAGPVAGIKDHRLDYAKLVTDTAHRLSRSIAA